MKLLMFAGAGSVGKTALLNKCAEMAKARGLTVATHFSSTRETYAKYGLTNESDALKDPEFNKNFQHQVMQDNIDNLKKAIELNKDVDLFIADRTPYDYIAYYFTVFQNALSLELIAEKRLPCDLVMEQLLNHPYKHVHIITLPYPTAWAVETQSSDGWRADKTGKNFIWSSVVEAELADAERRLHANAKQTPPLFMARLPSFAERGNVETRAVAVLMQVFPNLR